MAQRHLRTIGALALVFAAGLTFGAALSRWLAESMSSHGTFLYGWMPTSIVSAVVATLVTVSALWLLKRGRGEPPPLTVALHYLPLLLPALYLLQPQVNTLRAGVLLVGSLALVASLVTPPLWRRDHSGAIVPLVVFLLPLALYLRTLGPTVGQHDTFEFQVLSYQLGISHPTGYPLYVILGKLFTLLPVGSVAYRVNLSSALFASLTVLVLYLSTHHLTGDRSSAALAALTFGFTYSFWSQAVEAEVYALNALFVCLLMYLLLRCFGAARRASERRPALFVTICLVYGLSLTHHRTMLLLAPGILLYVLLHRPWTLLRPRLLLASLVAFLTPVVALHLFLPLRWWQIHGQSMTWREFTDLVLGTRFAAALQWDAVLHDPQRPAILWRSLLEQYPAPALLLAAAGLLALFWARRARDRSAGWREGLFLLVTFTAYAAFGLSYGVPDVSLFLIPANLVIAAGLGIGISSLHRGADDLLARWPRLLPATRRQLTASVTLALAGLLPLTLIWTNLPRVDRSDTFSSYDWAMDALQRDLPSGAVILADSEKMAPLHYLQTVEGIRPDTETGVFPDEATNRAEVGRRLSEGRPVFLARFLPGLEGSYHLRSHGPLVQVSTDPLLELPSNVNTLDVPFGSEVLLRGYNLEADEVGRDGTLRLTLYWQAHDTVRRNYDVRLRLAGPSGHVWMNTKSRPPVNGLYPTGAWRVGEIVPDFHELDLAGQLPPGDYTLEVGLFAPFGAESLEPQGGAEGYLTIERVTVVSSPEWSPSVEHALRANFGEQIMLMGYDLSSVGIPGRHIPLTLYWQKTGEVRSDYDVVLELTKPDGTPVWQARHPVLFGEHPTSRWARGEILAETLPVTIPQTADSALKLWVALQDPSDSHRVPVTRGWLATQQSWLFLAEVTIQPRPASPPDAPYLPANFEDKMWLVDYEIQNVQVRRGDALSLTLTWQALATMDEDYTVFVHILDDDDRIWGQEDIQPVRGTHPTTHWTDAELVLDPHTLWTDQEAPLGLYRLEVGVYLLRTMERLYLLDSAGDAIGESLIIDLIEIVP
jgi:hypothetical protein